MITLKSTKQQEVCNAMVHILHFMNLKYTILLKNLIARLSHKDNKGEMSYKGGVYGKALQYVFAYLNGNDKYNGEQKLFGKYCYELYTTYYKKG